MFTPTNTKWSTRTVLAGSGSTSPCSSHSPECDLVQAVLLPQGQILPGLTTPKSEVQAFSFIKVQSLTLTPSALPFALSPEDAMYTLAPYASANCYFPNLVSSVLAYFLPREFAKDRLTIFRPTRIEPVYFPGWIIDAEVEVDAQSKDEGDEPVKVNLDHTYS